MVLNVWDSIRNFFINLFTNVIWQNIFLLLAGILIGIIIGFIFYFIFFAISDKKAKPEKSVLTEEEKISKSNEVYDKIESFKQQHLEETKDYPISLKLKTIRKTSINLARDVAGIYYPKTYEKGLNDPKFKNEVFYEISMEEILILSSKVHDKIQAGLNKYKFTKKLKNYSIKSIVDKVEIKKEKSLEEQEKKQNKMPNPFLSKIKNMAMTGLGINRFFNYINKKISGIVLEAVGKEVAKAYSKNNFNEITKDKTSKKNKDSEVVVAK